jgi:PAS domain S-box-containing protein
MLANSTRRILEIAIALVYAATLVLLWEVNASQMPGSMSPAIIGLIGLLVISGLLVTLLYVIQLRQRELLVEGEKRYRTILETAQEGIWTVDAEARITYVNRQLADLLGYNPDAMMGSSIFDFFADACRENGHQWFARCQKEFVSEQLECRLQRADGSVLWTQLSSSPLLDDETGFTGVLATVTDISERRLAAEALRQSEARFRAIAETAPIPITITRFDDGMYLYFNSKVPELLGMTAEELRQQRATRFYEDPQVRQRLLDEVREKGFARGHEVVLIRSDGTRIWGLTSAQLIEFDGEKTMLSAIMDITDRKLAEEALRQSEERHRALAQAVPDMIVRFDRDGYYLDVKMAADFTPVTPIHQYPGRKLHDLLPDEVAEGGLRSIRQALETGQTQEYEYELQDGDRLRQFEARMVPSGANEVIAIVRDMTRIRQTERSRLELAVERERLTMLSHFIRDVSHDLRTPLAIVGSSLYLLQRKLDADAKARVQDHLTQIDTQINHLGKQIQNLFTLSSLVREQVILDLQPHQINDLLAVVIGEQLPLAHNRKQHLEFIPGEGLPVTLVDGEELRRAFRHLIANAISYTEPGGEITVSSRLEGSEILVEIADNGIGIEAKHLSHIFEPFYREDSSRSLDTGGLGLGLSIVQMVIEAHSGQITVTSQPGLGSTFHVSLPLALPAEEPPG